ncbi:MAG: GNAT family N-acetyltransferase [Byssovorax sp.]
MITVQSATPAMFEDVHRLLLGFDNPRMNKDDWRRMLFQYPWKAEEESRGYVLSDGGRAVGFLGTIFSTREIEGKTERFCHLSSWIVLPEYRSRSLSLLAAVARLDGYTIVSSTPSATSVRLFSRIGHRTLDDRELLLPPLAGVRELCGLFRASMTTDEDEVRAGLTGETLRCFDDHRRSLGAHLLLRRDGRSCWATATLKHRRGIRFASVRHMSDRQLFWECLPLAKLGFLRTLGAPALAVDARFAEGRHVPFAVPHRLWTPRLYRPAHEAIRPALVDGLYSELMGLRQ